MVKKNQFVQRLAEKKGVAKKEAAEWVDMIFEEITKIMKANDKVNITGFGIFRVADRAARVGRNPQTGAPVNIPAKRAPKFRAGKVLKEAIGTK